jgi:hypothetical protein
MSCENMSVFKTYCQWLLLWKWQEVILLEKKLQIYNPCFKWNRIILLKNVDYKPA